MSRLKDLSAAGTSVWLDFVERGFLHRGELTKLIEEDGVSGVTSNPAIFQKAMAPGGSYDADLRAMAGDPGMADPLVRYERMAIEDIRAAADMLAGVYAATAARDGYVSLEVSPRLARDAEATVREALDLWKRVDRPNLMIKVPGTEEGALAVGRLIEEGLSVNVTLLFSVDAYRRVADAYMTGLSRRLRAGKPIDRIASVASFFVSRIDAMIDGEIDRRIAGGDAEAERLRALRGQAAIANARLAYAVFEEILASSDWATLARASAMPQRLLWASTGTKDPTYSPTLYVDELIGPETVNTMPPATLAAFREQGQVSATLPGDVAEAQRVIAGLKEHGIDLATVTSTLTVDGIASFKTSFDEMLRGLQSAG
ncbi:transaldolase [Sphingomonas sp.]|uniref:transaldolase n=1 Tax=Sphingomonas sp. TaxID=28214 RepID=UPI000DB772AE|nr:transaldolase [Sphingomonas sp.]PZU08792.1 MAG: transaldolase [Sphingomonas sp.]